MKTSNHVIDVSNEAYYRVKVSKETVALITVSLKHIVNCGFQYKPLSILLTMKRLVNYEKNL